MSWKPEVDGIEKRRQLAAKLGGEAAVAKQHELGRLTIRERIDALVDAGSFREQGGIAGEPEYGESAARISPSAAVRPPLPDFARVCTQRSSPAASRSR